MTRRDEIIECVNVVKHFPTRSKALVHAVNDVTFAIESGETLGLVGESGSGKTTVGRLILGLIAPTAGVIRYRGQTISNLTPRRMRDLRPRIQAVFQDPYDSLDPRFRVNATIREPLERMELLRSDVARRDRVAEVAEMVGLEPDLLDKYPHQLSSGQQQKVAVARALASNPDFVVLDEPTSVLSPKDRAELVELLRRLQQELSAGFLFITHDLKVVERIAKRVAVMYLGKIVECGKVVDIFRAPTHPYTQALLAAILPPDPAHRGSVRVVKGEIPSPIDLPRGCPFASRCPLALPTCTTSEPQLESNPYSSDSSHEVACFRAEVAGVAHADQFRRLAEGKGG